MNQNRSSGEPPRKPDYTVTMLHKPSSQSAPIGGAWKNDDGSIRIKLNPFVRIPENLMDYVITCWPSDGNRRPAGQQRAQSAASNHDYRPTTHDVVDVSDIFDKGEGLPY